MKKNLTLLVLGVLFVFGSVYAQNMPCTMPNTTKVITTKVVTETASLNAPDDFKPNFKGQVVGLDDMMLGGDGRLNKAQALKLLSYGKPVVFKSGNKIYFIYNTNAASWGKELAKYASFSQIGIKGKAKKVKGLNIIIAEKIHGLL